jgi:hypothetical protein
MHTTLVATLLLGSLVVQQPLVTVRQWTTIRDKDAGVVAEFPAPPERETQPNGMIRWMVTLDNDQYAYIVGSLRIPAERMAVGVPRLLDDAVAGGINNVPGAQKVSETAIQVGGHPGRELLVTVPPSGGNLRMLSRAVIAGDRLFIVTAVSPAQGYDQREVDRFLLSLVVMPR